MFSHIIAGYGYAPPPPPDQFVTQGVPAPPGTPGAAPLAYTQTPAQSAPDLSKPGPQDFSFSQFGKL